MASSHHDAPPSAPPAPLDAWRSLGSLRIASPCRADWRAMAGDERVRFCDQCQKNVYNLSAMSHAEAEALLRQAESKPCVRFYRRADGTILTSDCPEGARRTRRQRRLTLVARGVALSAAAAVYSACQPSRGEPEGARVSASNAAPGEVGPAPEDAKNDAATGRLDGAPGKPTQPTPQPLTPPSPAGKARAAHQGGAHATPPRAKRAKVYPVIEVGNPW